MELLALGQGLAALDRFNDGSQPVGDLQSGGLTRQQMIAEGAQHDGQVAEQSFGGGIILALAMLANHCNKPVGE